MRQKCLRFLSYKVSICTTRVVIVFPFFFFFGNIRIKQRNEKWKYCKWNAYFKCHASRDFSCVWIEKKNRFYASRHTFNLSSVKLCLRSFLISNYFCLVYKDEVGGWAPPTELSQSSGAAAHTYTWFSLTTYLLIYNVILEILYIYIYLSDTV